MARVELPLPRHWLLASRESNTICDIDSTESLLRSKYGRCPVIGRRLSQGWPLHTVRLVSILRPSNEQSSYTVSTISGRRLTVLTNQI